MRKALIASLALLSLPGLGRADDLQTACRKGDLAAIKALLDQGADPNAKDRHGQPLLEDALITGRVAVIKLLLEKGADVDSKQPNGDAVIFCAINPANGTGGGPEAVKLLLDKGAHVDVKNGRGNTPLAEAIYGFQGLQPDVIKLLLAKGAECAPLQAAAFRGPAAAVKDLLDKGADVHAKDGYQLTALHWAALGGQAEVAQLLLDKGADTKAGDADGRPPLQYAAAGQPAGYGLQLGGAVRVRHADLPSDQPHHAADGAGRAAVAKLLLDKGAALDGKDSRGWTALMQAANGGPLEVVQLLLEKAADVNVHATDRNGLTPLHLAAKQGDAELVKLLLAKGADPNAKESHGLTPLAYACGDDVIKLLGGSPADAKAQVRALWQKGADAKHRGDLAAARAAWTEALKLDPDNAAIKQSLADLDK
jgi:ankyrin repeat protein